MNEHHDQLNMYAAKSADHSADQYQLVTTKYSTFSRILHKLINCEHAFTSQQK